MTSSKTVWNKIWKQIIYLIITRVVLDTLYIMWIQMIRKLLIQNISNTHITI